MPLGFNAYVPPVHTDEEVNKTITDHNQVKNTDKVYQITAKNVKGNLVASDKKVGDKLDGPDQVEIAGPDQLEVNDAKAYDVAHAWDWIEATNDNVWLCDANSSNPNDWVKGTDGMFANTNGKIWVKGRIEGNTTLQNKDDSSDPDKDIEIIAEGTPITLESFDVMKKDGHPVLSWATASETNNDYFVIERSFDGRDFEAIDTIKSKAENGTSREKLEYSYTDASNSLPSIVYYRLTQVDFDGKKKVYKDKVISVTIENEDAAPTLSPNPASNGQVTVEIFNKNQDEYRIVNLRGQKVADGRLSLGQNDIQLSSLPEGQYFVQVKGSNKALKLIVQ